MAFAFEHAINVLGLHQPLNFVLMLLLLDVKAHVQRFTAITLRFETSACIIAIVVDCVETEETISSWILCTQEHIHVPEAPLTTKRRQTDDHALCMASIPQREHFRSPQASQLRIQTYLPRSGRRKARYGCFLEQLLRPSLVRMTATAVGGTGSPWQIACKFSAKAWPSGGLIVPAASFDWPPLVPACTSPSSDHSRHLYLEVSRGRDCGHQEVHICAQIDTGNLENGSRVVQRRCDGGLSHREPRPPMNKRLHRSTQTMYMSHTSHVFRLTWLMRPLAPSVEERADPTAIAPFGGPRLGDTG